MKRLLLMSASLLALMAAAPTASATTFGLTGEIANFPVLVTGTYEILAFGAQGGDGSTDNKTGAVGGKGAKIQGDFQLTAGEQLKIVVGGAGQSGSYYGGGGGGGSFVIGPNGKPLLVAGGGGGAGGGVGPRGGNPTPPRGHSRLSPAPAGRKARMAATAPACALLATDLAEAGAAAGTAASTMPTSTEAEAGAASRATAATEAARMGD
jgi:hypothetical protein